MGFEKGVEYYEFRDGYAVTTEAEVTRVIEGYRLRKVRRNGFRLFAARLEELAAHKNSKVDLARILNCNGGRRGVRRLGRSEIERAGKGLDAWLSANTVEISRSVIVSRKVLRHIAFQTNPAVRLDILVKSHNQSGRCGQTLVDAFGVTPKPSCPKQVSGGVVSKTPRKSSHGVRASLPRGSFNVGRRGELLCGDARYRGFDRPRVLQQIWRREKLNHERRVIACR